MQSKTFIKWPTIGFTLLLASRFIIEIVKQIQREREGVSPHKLNMSMSPFSYSSMSIDVDPLISAAVGIYIFILFVYNHSLEFGHQDNPTTSANPILPFHNHQSSPVSGGGSDCGHSDISSDTVQLLPSLGDTNNNSNNVTSVRQHNILNSALLVNNSTGGGNNNGVLMTHPPITTIPNPLFELDSRRTRPASPRITPALFPQSPITQYKIDAV